MKHDIYRACEGAKSSPYNELDRTVEEPPVIEPPKALPLPWRFESGFGWGRETMVVAANHDNRKGVAGSHTIIGTRDVSLVTLRYLATAGNNFPRAIELLKRLVQRNSAHAVVDITKDAETLLRELGAL